MKLSLVVPCYNEAENVAGLKANLWPVAQRLVGPTWDGVEIVLVDDGSRDNTFKLLEQEFGALDNVVLVRHLHNRGLGAALRTGFAASSGDVVVATDSDASYPFSQIENILERLTPDIDIVTASPYHPEGGVDNVPAYRIFLSQGASLCYRVLVNPRLHTYTAMFRVYRRRVLDETSFDNNGFLGVSELLIKAMLNGARVAEYPCRLRVRRYGQSKARILKIVRSHLRFMGWLLGYRVRRLFKFKIRLPRLFSSPGARTQPLSRNR